MSTITYHLPVFLIFTEQRRKFIQVITIYPTRKHELLIIHLIYSYIWNILYISNVYIKYNRAHKIGPRAVRRGVDRGVPLHMIKNIV